MKLSQQRYSFGSLKGKLIIGFLLSWNLGFVLAAVSDSFSVGPCSQLGSAIVSFVCLVSSAASGAIAASERVQACCIAPSRKHNFRAYDFGVMSFITAISGIASAVNVFIGFASLGVDV